MAFNMDYLAGPVALGGSKSQAQLYVYDTADNEATVVGTGYFANCGAGSDPSTSRGMSKGDQVLVRYYDSVTTKATFYGAQYYGVSAIDADGDVTVVTESQAVALTATAAGDGTGQIPAGARVVTVTASDANHIITLPAPIPGTEILILKPGATGFELRSSTPASISINGGTGASAESALAATALVIRVVCLSATAWIANSHVAAGTESAVEAAA